MHGRDEIGTHSLVRNLNGRDDLGYLGVGGKIILKLGFKEIGCENVNWIHLARTEPSGRLS
jgi:hypothetical protein